MKNIKYKSLVLIFLIITSSCDPFKHLTLDYNDFKKEIHKQTDALRDSEIKSSTLKELKHGLLHKIHPIKNVTHSGLSKEDFKIKASLEYKLSEEEKKFLEKDDIEISLEAFFKEGKFIFEVHPNFAEMKSDNVEADEIPDSLEKLKKITTDLQNLVSYVLVLFALKVGIYKKFPQFIPLFLLMEAGQNDKIQFYKIPNLQDKKDDSVKFVVVQKVPQIMNTYAKFEIQFNPKQIRNIFFEKIQNVLKNNVFLSKQQMENIYQKMKDLIIKVKEAPDFDAKRELIITNLTREIYNLHKLFTIDQIMQAGKKLFKFSIFICFQVEKCFLLKKQFENWVANQTANIGTTVMRNIKSSLSFYFPRTDPQELNEIKKQDDELEKSVLSTEVFRYQKKTHHYHNKKRHLKY